VDKLPRLETAFVFVLGVC